MDFYTYYLRRLEKRSDQTTALHSCRDMAMRLFDTGPLTWAIASGAALLTAIHEANLKNDIDPLPTFEEVEQALFAELQGVRLDLEMNREMGIRNTGCGRPKHRNRDYRKER